MTLEIQSTRIVVIRHGETDWNVETRIQGQIDVGLNAAGRWQALQMARSLAEERIDAIYSSDLCRARETADALGDTLGLSIHTDPVLRERSFGVFEGLTFAEVERQHPDAARRWRQRDASFGPVGGEPLGTFATRAVMGVTAIAAKHRGQHIAIVTHGGVLDVLYRAAARMMLDAPRTWQLGNASINRLLHSDQGFSLVGWGDDSHLGAPPVGDAAERPS
jgi:probable phosphoglycerate mutase